MRSVCGPGLAVLSPEQHVLIGHDPHHLVAVAEPSQQDLQLTTLDRDVRTGLYENIREPQLP